ncbi:FG-GAP-like repeat-containing protein [Portibacter lacus]|uniref:FG-GAP-like repeat-containing protein n=1 Tax=Portibacter lacus TaxID=1099794 RepID=UPI001F26D861|nr:FG-GAP-like repeat-containing protein [Portibacter lacus]
MLKLKCLFLLLLPIYLLGQVSFQPNQKAFGNIEIHSQIPIAVVDINNDLLDDIVTLDKGNHLKVFYQSHNSEEFYAKDYGLVSTFDQLALGVGDLDNDGLKEIFVGGYYDGIKIYKAFAGSEDYLQFSKTEATFYTQNISLVDINGDGFLDLYVNDDDGPPKIFGNADGSSYEKVEWIDFGYEGEDASGNYGSIWTDFDDDGDLDLYISKCRLGVNDAADPRRINQLFVNDGLGGFLEQAGDYGLDDGEQSWVSDFADLDNDGDKDVVVINHTGGNNIYENNGDGSYSIVDTEDNWNALFEGLQLIIRDFDNDGLKDILIGGIKSKLFWNKGGLEFEEDPHFFGNKEAVSLAVGDLNNDGFWDVYNSYSNGITDENDYVADEIMINHKNDNTFFKVNLMSENGNSDAIGSTCELYGDWGVQSYELRSGESYGINNSLSVIFGLGTHSTIDSLVVKWPNGYRSVYIDLEVNNNYIVNDSDCIHKQIDLNYEEDIICSNTTLTLTSPDFAEYKWSNGSTSQTIEVENSGLYKISVTDESGCTFPSTSLYIRDVSEIAKPFISAVDPEAIYCASDMIVLETQYDSVWWNNKIKATTYLASAGEPVYATYHLCDTLTSEIYNANLFIVDTPAFSIDTIMKGDDAIFKVTGSDISWFETESAEAALAEGNEFVIANLQSDTIIFAENRVSKKIIDSIQIDLTASEFGLPPSHINGGVIFSVEHYNTILESVNSYTDTAAMRRIQIKDYWGTVIHEKEVFISPTDSVIQLGFKMQPASYYLLTTDEAYNQENLGSRSPRLFRGLYNESVYDLKSKDGNVVIQASTGTPDSYYSFYNWKTIVSALSCVSDRVGVPIIVDQSSSISSISSARLEIFPNPVDDVVFIRGDFEEDMAYHILSMDGRLLKKERMDHKIDLSSLHSGIYFLKIASEVYKIVKL